MEGQPNATHLPHPSHTPPHPTPHSLPSLQPITNISLPTAVNYVNVSPDGTKMVAVGDSPQVYLFDVTPTGGYQRIATLASASDAGFSCSWNRTSEKFAVGSQDGFVTVWDIRSTEHLAKIGSAQVRGFGGCWDVMG